MPGTRTFARIAPTAAALKTAADALVAVGVDPLSITYLPESSARTFVSLSLPANSPLIPAVASIMDALST